ncbi:MULTISPECIES: hypothetical protein [Caballeronia]|uniref:hypothetical protein n=1 Tax=Caballeronia TaxID=1827195 RepID=UPI00158E2FAD|nr:MULTISPECIES: hypothetical protein [Caballeronia]MCG7402006.1 hypothetical protein [Caballeronia zhejiangensis]MCI1042591.1 hypothetical protein [Caballeronia zhejiangensis]
MNDDHRRFFDARSLDRRRHRLPLIGQLIGGLLASLVIVLLMLAITAAAWAILYLIHTAP